jgi:FAD/FMN-containing dehydrogenase
MDALPVDRDTPATPRFSRSRSPECQVNDVHSRLNATSVRRVLRPQTVGELKDIVRAASAAEMPVSICGARHAMGGQQFATGATLIDTTSLGRVIDIDAERGLVTVGAGIDWPRLMNQLAWAFPTPEESWGIIQKQTGADGLTIGGALASNIHGRGLRLRPFIADVESFDLVNADGDLVTCSRSENARLFSLAIGGYGLFGAIARVTLRLARRSKVERRVSIGCVDDLPRLFDLRIREGYEYGDFQFATDPASREFLQVGVFSCYRPVPRDVVIPDDQRALSPSDWRRLLFLAHTDKSRAFAEYARYYMATDRQIYWSDTHQLGDYPEAYHVELDRDLGARSPGSEMITELYVPRESLPQFMSSVRSDARQHGVDIIYGTIRVIEQDDESVLAWARERWACIVFNLHVAHTPEGIAKAGGDFRRLIDRAIECGGSYYLTYHRWATAEQLLACHPRVREFMREKRRLDPRGVFTNDWFRHHASVLGGEA